MACDLDSAHATRLCSQTLTHCTPSVAPTIEEVSASGDEYARWNLRMLRNPGLINMIDGCAVLLPCHSPGEEAPIGLMVAGVGGSDRRVLAVARAIEESLAARAE
eukprot:CAMPEP_0202765506 /NCGR_PEP_ID=MMETSP1388-20130828/28464_1 /ASSEMBLY_ACC=CAM_ASM_000864 /TAXON_ID=37098 /ORGANISM="Isochrysis sp, Strain CCMP1244" /LENGTH=104 /DNA_ID=CAMNT_0049434081 /DNA_START=115 /DNA_END=429 /DNA_ORIENTATION=-